ncbi:MAG TPA: hypothetical protein VF556_01885 [Pyrinomonadaceae bacterium]|jgi:ribonuclease HI
MLEIKMNANEEKPSVVRATDSFINETHKVENESDYPNDCAFINTTIQSLPSENNIGNTITIECAGRYESYPDKAAGWAFVALDENFDIIYEEYGSDLAFDRDAQVFHDYRAIIKALEWALNIPIETEILVATDSKYVTASCPLNCECNNCVSTELKHELFELMSENNIDSITLISKETNRAAELAKQALAESKRIQIDFDEFLKTINSTQV